MDKSCSIENIKEIYGRLCDDESRYIFKERLQYSISGEIEHIINIVGGMEGLSTFASCLKEKNLYVWGAGARGGELALAYGKRIRGIIDNDRNKWGSKLSGVEIQGLDTIKIGENDKVVITPKKYSQEISNQLLKAGIRANQVVDISNVWDILRRNQYFDCPQMQKTDEEIFIDAGCFDGYSSERFIEWCDGGRHKIYCFEPDEKNIEMVKNNNALNDNVTIISKGLWNKAEILRFNSAENPLSCVDPSGSIEVEVDALDNIIPKEEDVTFIKMDIEGSEYEALLGARRIITEQKPKLAICIYHKPEDVITIPNLILSMNPNYKFYIRHYSPMFYETVLYAL